LSVIHPENESYLLQEANKDIDYIALGIPFIGNDRPPTLEKIKRGVGVLINDKHAIASLINNEHDQYNKCVASCAGIASDYSLEKFKISLLKVYSRITQ
jgi:glycosyltransferase involved in cell wall biosynthesis